jgi:hypothetical protein
MCNQLLGVGKRLHRFEAQGTWLKVDEKIESRSQRSEVGDRRECRYQRSEVRGQKNRRKDKGEREKMIEDRGALRLRSAEGLRGKKKGKKFMVHPPSLYELRRATQFTVDEKKESRSQRSEVGGRRECRYQKSEIRGQKNRKKEKGERGKMIEDRASALL